jgi:hypothetical protein
MGENLPFFSRWEHIVNDQVADLAFEQGQAGNMVVELPTVNISQRSPYRLFSGSQLSTTRSPRQGKPEKRGKGRKSHD